MCYYVCTNLVVALAVAVAHAVAHAVAAVEGHVTDAEPVAAHQAVAAHHAEPVAW